MAIGAKVKGITIEFDGDTSKLGNALKKIDSETKGLDRSLKQVNNALKFNPKNTELVAQKQTLLKQKIDQTKQRLDALRQTQAKLDDDPAVDKTSQEYMELRREIITTESKLKHFENEQKKLNNYKFTQLSKSFQQVGSKISAVGRRMTTTMSIFGAAAVYAGNQLIKMSQQQAQAEQKLAEIYKTRMGVDKKAVQSTLALASAEQKLGVVGDEVQIAAAQQLATYAKTPDTVNKMLPALNNLLVQQKGLNGTQEDAVGLANLFGKAMMGQTGALKRAGISFTKAQEAILKTGTEEQKAAMIAEVVTQNVGHMNKEFAKTDAGKMQQAKNALGDMGEEIGAVLLPAVADLVKWLQGNLMPKIEAFIGWMKEHPQVAKFALAIAGIATVAGPLITIIGGLVSGIGTLIGFLPALGTAFTALLGPIGLIAAAIAAAITVAVLLYKNWDKIKKKIIAIWNSIKTAAKTIWSGIKNTLTTIWNGIKTAAKTIWGGIKTVVTTYIRTVATIIKTIWVNAANAIKGVWNGLKKAASTIWNGIKNAITHPIQTAKNIIKKIVDTIRGFFKGEFKLPKIKLPHFSITPKGWKFKDLLKGKIPKLGIEWYAKGGIFRNPSVIGVGEAGSEAVVPLGTFWQKMDAMADSIVNGIIAAGAMGTAGAPVNVTLYAFPNGPQMGSWVVNTYDTYKRRLG